MGNDEAYLALAESILENIDGKTREDQRRTIAASIRRVSEMYLRALEALDERADASEAR